MDLWTVLAASIRRAITAVIGRTAPKPTATACVATSVDEPTAGTDFDPRQLSRARLLSELLAPVPPVEPGELNQACDTGPPQALPAALEAAITRRLLAARELLCRDMLTDLQGRPVMDSPARLAEWLRLHCVGLDHEVFLVIYLDSQHRLITVEQLFRGTLTQVSVYPREVLKQALAHGAAALALAHNHPSGGLEPSMADQRITQQLKTSLALIDVRVIDHFIVAGEGHYSFAEHGLI
jgi:DNA repair protein RadC